jgi:CIC family chloride channel protein
LNGGARVMSLVRVFRHRRHVWRWSRQRYAALRRWLGSHDAALLPVAVLIGAVAGLGTAAQSWIAHSLQGLLYGISYNRLSALESIHHPAKLLFLPLGGLLLALLTWLIAMRRTPVDVIEANAMHGGRIPWRDGAQVCAQTMVSNGFGASVGLEAAYAQFGGTAASSVGQVLSLKRSDLRIMVGAGAGAAIGAAFSSPLTGAFYALNIVIGAYTPAAMAPVAAAALTGALVDRAIGGAPFLTVVEAAHPQSATNYLLYAGLGLLCALVGILIMRFQGLVEAGVAKLRIPPLARPFIGGLLLMPIAWASPQALSSGHGALRLELALQPAEQFLLTVFALKVLASVISLSFGFRGGLFFASLFLGSLLGPVYAGAVNLAAGHEVLSALDAALVGMAALSVVIVGGPMTLSLLVLETTHDFALVGVVLTATLCASAITRNLFGYSFSTWRFHLRGARIRSPRDIGWNEDITASDLMRRDPVVLDSAGTVEEFRDRVALGSTSRVLLRDAEGRFHGIVETARAYDPSHALDQPLAELVEGRHGSVGLREPIGAVLDAFDREDADDLAVVDRRGRIVGYLTAKYVARRYVEESEKAQARLFGE